jgi:2-dehydro-3-deoxy-L-rhamnonate dehydrogenase (NAD+)
MACFTATGRWSLTCSATSTERIVNIASIAGKEGNPNESAYSASKAGVIAPTKSLGKELARQKSG